MSAGSGLDEGLIRVANYQNHPTNDFYKVFFFYEEAQADFFEGLLKEANIWYERSLGEKKGEPLHLFGIKKKDLNKVYRLNNIAIGKFRRKFVPNKYQRIAVVLVGFIIVLIALIGFIKSR